MQQWLAEAPTGLTLHLLLKCGGMHQSQAWLGLSAVGASEADARSRLQAYSDDLGEALDAWSMYPDIPNGPPRYPQKGWLLTTPTPDAPSFPPSGSTTQALLNALSTLSRRETPLSLAIDIPAGGLSPKLVNDIARTQRQLHRRVAHDDRSFRSLFRPASESSHVLQDVQSLWSKMLGQQVRIHLHGPLPGTLLRGQLLDALEQLFGVELHLGKEMANIGPTTPGITLNPQGLLNTLTVGATEDADASFSPDMDDLPF